MRKGVFVLFLVLLPFVYSQSLDIPEVTVYGEREIRIGPIEKGPLPFEEEPIFPYYSRKKASVSEFVIRKGVEEEADRGMLVRTAAGTVLEGYLVGFLRRNYYPLELGIEGSYDFDNEETSTLNLLYFDIFTRTSIEGIYLGVDYLNSGESNRWIPLFSIRGISDIVRGSASFAYSDSLFFSGDVGLYLPPIDLELEIDNELRYILRVVYADYPLRAGLSWFKKHIYPELLYFLPSGMNLYLKGTLIGKNRIFEGMEIGSRFERNFFDPYYRVEFGRGAECNLAIFYRFQTFSDSTSYVGLTGSYRAFMMEAGYSFESSDPYLKIGSVLCSGEVLTIDLYGILLGKEDYLFSTDIGFRIARRFKIGLLGSLDKGRKDGFDGAGYLSFWF